MLDEHCLLNDNLDGDVRDVWEWNFTGLGIISDLETKTTALYRPGEAPEVSDPIEFQAEYQVMMSNIWLFSFTLFISSFQAEVKMKVSQIFLLRFAHEATPSDIELGDNFFLRLFSFLNIAILNPEWILNRPGPTLNSRKNLNTKTCCFLSRAFRVFRTKLASEVDWRGGSH